VHFTAFFLGGAFFPGHGVHEGSTWSEVISRNAKSFPSLMGPQGGADLRFL